jgi:hypothetical protein
MRNKSASLGSKLHRQPVVRNSAHAGSPYTRRDFIRRAAATGSVVLGSALFGKASASTKLQPRPNIVFFLGEGARWDESSIAGNTLLKTPHIDRIAREGATFLTTRSLFSVRQRLQVQRASALHTTPEQPDPYRWVHPDTHAAIRRRSAEDAHACAYVCTAREAPVSPYQETSGSPLAHCRS